MTRDFLWASPVVNPGGAVPGRSALARLRVLRRFAPSYCTLVQSSLGSELVLSVVESRRVAFVFVSVARLHAYNARPTSSLLSDTLGVLYR